MSKAYLAPNPIAPNEAVTIDPDKCIGCNNCVNHCRTQTIIKNPEKGKPPVVIYPDECWFCGCCIDSCRQGAITMRFPINQRIFFKRKDTGKIYRIGGPDSPEQSYFEPPIGE